MTAIHRIYARVFRVWRLARMRRFMEIFQLGPGDRVLDIGGYPQTWTVMPARAGSITCVNVLTYPWDEASAPDHHITVVKGDGRALPYPDDAFTIAFSNSVIEHVGAWEAQQRFAAEVRRVAPRLWVQTPAYECPIEPHYLAPFIHWFPPAFRRRTGRWLTPWGWIAKPTAAEVEEMAIVTRLLSRREMHALFPDCVILTERLFGIFPKSYVACRGADSAQTDVWV
jgi:hypothetical protein